ncbi:hypothetical protein [Variovorax ginsengisoli]|uniref:Chemotaxis protein n=1 Tax=Variovorax ginsengisoli TaxID=363844 RepID=A0ABT9S196_9BURK|nr:hypothetical protein [Variovorax ginsengisoli]MDP9898116.1 hypothetical protein [Variovorax ginsengisoli]
MNPADPKLTQENPLDEDIDEVDGALDDGDDAPENEAELADATGIDLSDASELDADHVPIDEEAARVVHAPD